MGIKPEWIEESKAKIIELWEDDGNSVIAACAKVEPFNGTIAEFLDHCTTCGGNWGGMLLTGIHKLYPDVWDAIPDDMGYNPFAGVLHTLILLGVDCSE